MAPTDRGLGGLFHQFKKLLDDHGQGSSQQQWQPPPPPQGYPGQGQQSQQHFAPPPRPPNGTYRSYFLAQEATPSSTWPALQPIEWPYPGNLPNGSLVFSFTYPDPSTNEQTRFFLDCLPDPVGVAYHAMMFVRSCLTLRGTNPPWRHRLVNIALKDEDGLAWACGSDITISLRWAANILKDFKEGRRDRAGCCYEFKGVILHELVHIVQYDGSGSSPSWLTESIADSVRFMGHLGAKHWCQPGYGKAEKGYEDAYDKGAMFLCWLMGELPGSGGGGTQTAPTAYPTQAPQAPYGTSSYQQYTTQYPHGYDPNQQGPPPVPPHPNAQAGGKPRRGPFPDIVRQIDTRLRTERYSPKWWVEMTGASLDQLWAEYQAYYK